MSDARARTSALALVAGLACLVAAPRAALAHRLDLDVRREGGRVRAEAFFSDGTACAGARVRVLDAGAADAVLLEATTDAEGAVAFDVPAGARGPLVVEVNDGGGHLATAEVAIDEAAAGAVAPAEPAAAPTSGGSATPGAGRGAVPWARVAIGLAVIAALGIGFALLQGRMAAR